MTKTKLSIIITAHDEGLMAHHTMLSVFRALEDFKERYEIIIHIDSGDKATKDYFARYKDNPKVRILENDFKDLGESRNHSVQQAKGTYVAILDADDLVSENYFSEMIKVLEAAEDEIVVHPQCCLSFEDLGSTFCLQELAESKTPEIDAALALHRHRWIAAVSGKRETFLAHPYIKTENGIGCEDYALSTELTASGISHKIAKETIYFYRKKQVSLLQKSNARHYAQPYSELFEIEKWKTLELPAQEELETKKTWKQKLMDQYVRLRRNKILNKMIEPFATQARKMTGKKLIETREVPPEVMDEWIKMARIEVQIFPTQEIVDRLLTYETETVDATALIYQQLCRQVRAQPDYIFMVPWIMTGGADKVLLNYLKALGEIHPEWQIAVITTREAKNEWEHKLPENAYLVDFGNATAPLWLGDREIILTTLLTQLRCPRIHIINSIEAIDWINMHQELAKNQFEISASLFCYGILAGTDGKGIWDFADPYITRIYPAIKKFYTDNSAVVEYLVKKEGFDREKFTVHHQPATENSLLPPRQQEAEPKKLKILWAGRISVQKNPKLLVRIAEKLDPTKVQIDAYGKIDALEQDGFEFPKDTSVLKYYGPFQGFQSLHPEQYDVLLHTSMIDGMPNVILEAAASGLVTIASNVGGIGDFVQNDKTGFLIDDADNEDAYIKVINRIQQNPSVLNGLAEGAEELLQDEFAWKNFVKTVKKDF